MLGSKKPGIRETRYYKSVGLGIKTPRTAIEGTYVDKKCPWTGALHALSKAARRLASAGGGRGPCLEGWTVFRGYAGTAAWALLWARSRLIRTHAVARGIR